jgi:hypothetical protein
LIVGGGEPLDARGWSKEIYRTHKRTDSVSRSTSFSYSQDKVSPYFLTHSFFSFYRNFIMASSTKLAGVLVLLALSHLCAVAGSNPCYFPNGFLASSFVPCSPNGDGGCCAEGDFCTSLGYCISNSEGYHYRGACTDATWFNPSCPDYCLTDANCTSHPITNYALRRIFYVKTDICFFTQLETVALSM